LVWVISSLGLAALHQAVQAGYQDFVLDFCACIAAFAPPMLATCCQVMKLRNIQIEFEVLLPRDVNLAKLFHNTNWAHFLAPDANVSPGPIDTPIFGKDGQTQAEIEQTNERMERSNWLKRLGHADEIARATLFLVSDDASFAIGAELFVDGGLAEL
jgi:hypothetical protein